MGRNYPGSHHPAGITVRERVPYHLRGQGPFWSIRCLRRVSHNFGFKVNIAGCSYGAPGSYYGTDGFGWIKGRKKRAVPDLEKYHGKDIYLTEALTIEMKAALKNAVAEKKPFFATMAYYAVHTPFQPNKRYLKNYQDAAFPEKAKVFATMIESMDTSLGEILQQLEDLGVAEETLVLFLGDNGSDAPMGRHTPSPVPRPCEGRREPITRGECGFLSSPPGPSLIQTICSKNNCPSLPVPSPPRWRRSTISSRPCFSWPGLSMIPPSTAKIWPRPLKGEKWGRSVISSCISPQHRSSYYTVYRLGDWKIDLPLHQAEGGTLRTVQFGEGSLRSQ
jgi:hypothetical protein